MRGVEFSQKIVEVAELEPYDKKPQLLTVLLTPGYKELIFKYTVKSVLKKPVDVIRALFTMEYPADDDFDVNVNKGVAHIKLPERTKFDVNWFQAKYRVVAAIRKNTDVTDIEFLEHYEGTKPEEKKTKKPKTKKATKTKKTTKAKKSKK